MPKTLRETETYVEVQMARADPLNRAFVITLRADASSIGVTGCHNIDWPNRAAEIGIYIGEPEKLGKGYGTEAMELLLAFCFNELNLHRVFLRVFDFNGRAIESYRKCGFKEEGRLREAFFREGHYHDIVVMSILEEEFRARIRLIVPTIRVHRRLRRCYNARTVRRPFSPGHIGRRGAGVAEQGCLLSSYAGDEPASRVRIPPSPPHLT